MVGNSILPPPPSPMDIYIYYIYNLFFEIHCFLQAFVKKHQMDLSFYKMPLLYIFGKVMPNIFPVLRFHQYIYIYILETVTSKHQVPFLPSTSPNNCEFDSSNKTLAPNKKSEMSHFLHTMPLYILSLVLASNIMIVARHYI